jgi:hypothetical protein
MNVWKLLKVTVDGANDNDWDCLSFVIHLPITITIAVLIAKPRQTVLLAERLFLGSKLEPALRTS